MKIKLRIIGIAVIGLALVFGLIESYFYGDLDADGVLQETLFLPLSFILTFLGATLVAISFLAKASKKAQQK